MGLNTLTIGVRGQPSGHRLQMSFLQLAMDNRGSVLKRAVRVACGPVCVSIAAMAVREVESLSWFAAAINHPLAIQVFGVLFAFLVTARVGRALIRWWEGMMAVVNMQDGWGDACMFIMSYVKKELLTLHAQLDRNDIDDATREWLQERIKKLFQFGHKIIHWFSLASAVGLGTLKSGEARAFSEISCKYKDYRWLYSDEYKQTEQDKVQQKIRGGSEENSSAMEYLGELSAEEESELAEVEEKTLLVVNWLYEALAIADGEKFIQVPPPILAGMNSKIAGGMYSYLLAYRIAAVPYPFPLAQISAFLMWVFLLLMPVVVEKFTQAKMLTPLLSFLIALGYWGLNRVAIEIENPFGDDPNDLPLKAFGDTFIDHLMESSTNCLRNIGSKKNKSVHDYSDCAMGIIPCKPPAALEKKDFKAPAPTKTAEPPEATKLVKSVTSDSKTAAKDRPRARSADPRLRIRSGAARRTPESPENYKQGDGFTAGNIPFQMGQHGNLPGQMGRYGIDQNMPSAPMPWDQMGANFGTPALPGSAVLRRAQSPPMPFSSMPGIVPPGWPQQPSFFNVMGPPQPSIYQSPYTGFQNHNLGYSGYNGDYVDPDEIS